MDFLRPSAPQARRAGRRALRSLLGGLCAALLLGLPAALPDAFVHPHAVRATGCAESGRTAVYCTAISARDALHDTRPHDGAPNEPGDAETNLCLACAQSNDSAQALAAIGTGPRAQVASHRLDRAPRDFARDARVAGQASPRAPPPA